MKKPILPTHLRIPATEHGIRPLQLSKAAMQTITTLQQAGFEAYIVGGGVRDLLLNKHPKDFDIATSAHPEQVRPLFKRCLLIGRRFRLAHVYFGQHIIEVATFRANTPVATTDATENAQHQQHATTGLILRDNIYGTLEEDAWRRDFTINALYYDPVSGDILDFTEGYADLKQNCLRIIGDPIQRYREDPVRMLRAIRFISKLGLQLHQDSAAAFKTSAPLFVNVPTSRLADEFNKLFMYGHAFANFQLIQQYDLLPVLFHQTALEMALEEEKENKPFSLLIEKALQSTDNRIHENKPVTPAFLFAALLWRPYESRALILQDTHHQLPYLAQMSAASDVISQQNKRIGIPKRLGLFIRETYLLQNQLTSFRKRYINRAIRHPRFRAAYDFLMLRAASGENCTDAAAWWTDYQAASDSDRHELLRNLPIKGN